MNYKRRSIPVITCLLLVFSATIGGAQYAQRSGVDPKLAVAPAALQSAADDTTPVHNVWALRGIAGLLGWFPGAVAGAFAGAHVLDYGPCGRDDPGLKKDFCSAFFRDWCGPRRMALLK